MTEDIEWQPGSSEPASLTALQTELAENLSEMQKFEGMDAQQIFYRLSQYSARASEMRQSFFPTETRREASFRTRVIDPFIEECDRQFKLHSRIQAISEMDAKLAGGRFA